MAAITLALVAGQNRLASTVAMLTFLLFGVLIVTITLRYQAMGRRTIALCNDGPPPRDFEEALTRLEARIAAIGYRSDLRHPVTGLPTREHLFHAVSQDLAGEGQTRLLGVLRFADFDRLAAFDQDAANAALATFADRLAGASRACNCLAQVDRDCFAIWFAGTGEREVLLREFRALAYVASQDMARGAALLAPTVEAGLAILPDDGSSCDQLLARAIASLARPILSPGGDVILSQPLPLDQAREQFTLEQDLAHAIAADQLRMLFQPVVDLDLGRLIGAEALLRWDHPELGSISPARFIPVVESLGLADRYGLWVLNAACREANRWQDLGLGRLKVSVNLSARQLLDPGLRTQVLRTLARHGLDPRSLELELTETAAMADADRTQALFDELHATGVSLAIDDFGSGYSSLSYLKNLRFDKLKIDREFVTQLEGRRDSRAICKALIELGRGLDLVVLAEGVETADELETLRDLGCSVFQGYYFSRPLTADAFVELAQDGAWRTRIARYARGSITPIEGRRSA